MPWLDEADERKIKRMVQYALPLSMSRIPFPGKTERFIYRGLRWFAGFRLRRDFWAGGLDERIYRRFLGRTLSETYRP